MFHQCFTKSIKKALQIIHLQGFNLSFCGEYRNRTDDLLHAMQAL